MPAFDALRDVFNSSSKDEYTQRQAARMRETYGATPDEMTEGQQADYFAAIEDGDPGDEDPSAS